MLGCRREGGEIWGEILGEFSRSTDWEIRQEWVECFQQLRYTRMNVKLKRRKRERNNKLQK